MGLQTFDDWASTFGEVVSKAEMKPVRNSYRTKKRFAKFNNLPEFVAMYGGLYINTETNEWYCFSQVDKHGGRNAVNCLTEILGMDFKSAAEALTVERLSHIKYRTSERTPPKKRELVIPERADNMRKVFAYLCQTRKIDSKIVSEPAQDGLLYQDKRGNAVFVHRDESGKIVGAELQGTSSYQRFKGVAAGTSDSLFAVKIGTPNRAYVFESAIDLLSFRQLANPAKIQNSVLVSMAGLKPNSLKALSDRGLKLYACVDNDEKGIKFTSEHGLIPCNRILAENSVKDFNELLQTIERNREAQAKGNTIQTAEKNAAATKSHHDSKTKKAMRNKKPFRYSSEFFTPVKISRRGMKAVLLPRSKIRFGFLGLFLLRSENGGRGTRGCPLAKCAFGWRSRPKVLLSIALTSNT